MRKKKPVRYPWDKWLAYKRPYELKKGRDFKCAVHGMSVQIRNAAIARGMRVSVGIKGRYLLVTNLGNPRVLHG